MPNTIPALGRDTFLYSLLDRSGDVLLHLSNEGPNGERMAVSDELLPELKLDGGFEDVPMTGARVYTGSGHLRAGTYGLTVLLYRQSDHWDMRREATELQLLCAKAKAVAVYKDGAEQIYRFAGLSSATLKYSSFRKKRMELTATWEMGIAPGNLSGLFEAAVEFDVVPGADPDGSGPIGDLTHVTIIHGAGQCEIYAPNGLSGRVTIDGRNGLSVTLDGVSILQYFIGIRPAFGIADASGASVYGDLADPANIAWSF
jgi:hypothetical protein